MGIHAPARKRRLFTALLVATAVLAGVALTPLAANAVHTVGLFELDGNIADNAGAVGQDWSSFPGPVLPGDTAPVSTVFISDGSNGVDDTIYFGGGSQNNNDIPSWQWSCGSVSTKSDIEHAFASAYIKNNQLYLYFGADRYDPTGGTTNVGFWFLQNGGALQGGNGCPDSNPATNTFSGQHVDGDLFVFAEFNGGGGDSAVSIYEWQSGGLHLLAAKSSGSFCSADDSICALTNSQTIDSIWPYTDNQGSSADGHILQGGFVEGGINLSSIYAGLGKDLPCVNRFLAQTGSSHPDTGVLEDFAGGSFNVCSKLIVDKVTPSGDQTKFAFSASGPNGSDSFELADADAPHDSGQIKSGTYQVTESADTSVWNAPSVACEDQGGNDVSYSADGEVDIAPGATVTCTFTNTKRAQLTVVKKIVGGNGTTDAFDVQVDGDTKIDDAAGAETSSEAFAVSAGDHSVTETFADGSTAVSPSDWDVSFSGDCDADGEVTVGNDESKSCTITNSKRPRLTVVKEIEGGDGSKFDISVGGTQVLDDAGDGSSDERDYAPGNYSVSETFGDGEAVGEDWAVVFSGDCDENGSVTLIYGDAKTCTITNKRKPKLTVVKVIEGGNGASFDLAVNGSTVLDDVDGSGGQATNTYPVDTSYSVSETLGNGDAVDPDVWETSLSGDCEGVLAAGDDKTCTLTNKRKPKLTVVKVIEGGQGASFDLAVNGDTVLDDVDGPGGQATNTYEVGTSYSVSETLGNGDPVDPDVWETTLSDDCEGTLAAGDDKTCTLTNKRKPKLTVVKVIEGGQGASFDLAVNGETVLDDVDGAGGQVTNTYPVDTAYGVSETLGDGDPVDPDVWETSMSGDCEGVLAAGDDKTCTVTNKRKPKLTVVKVIAGGQGASFDLAVNGSTVLDDVDGSGGQVTNTYEVGTSYSVSETLGNGDAVDPAVWETSMSPDCEGVLAAGDDKTCTITNKRKPKLTVVKVIEGGNGASFDLAVNGDTVLDDVDGSGGQATNTYDVGTSYSVSETLGNGDAIDPAVWDSSASADCQGTLAAGEHKTCTVTNKRKPKLTVVKVIEGGNGAAFDLQVNGSTVLDDVSGSGGQATNTYPVDTAYSVSETMGNGDAVDPDVWETSMSGDCEGVLGAGDDKTCTVTNKRKPKLTVVKRILGGDGSTFDISVGQTKALDDADDGASDTRTYAPGTYPVAETLGNGDPVPGGWSTSFSSDCSQSMVTLVYGDDKTCTVTNSKLPILVVIKNVVGGAKSPSDFQISVSGDNPSPSSFGGSAEGTVVTLNPGGYDVSEVEDPHYTASYSADCKDGTIAFGESATCTITNTRKPSSITIEKVASPTSVPEPGGSVSFTLRVANTSPADAVMLTELTDSVYGDVFARGNCDALEGKVLSSSDGAAGGPDEATCSFSAMVSGNAGDPHHNVATVTGHDEDERVVTANDFADVDITDVAPSINVTKTADPESLPEPGGVVEFTVDVENTSVSTDPVTITSLVDDPDGAGPAAAIDLDGKGSCDVPQTIQPGETYTCKFTRLVTGNAGDAKTDVVTASGHDDDNHEVSDHDDATVTLTGVPSAIAVEKSANPTSIPAPGGEVTFTVVVKNTSEVDALTIDKLDDNVYGDLAGKGDCGALVGKVLQPNNHAAGGPDEATCSFTASVTGPGGSTHTDVVTVTGHDDDGQPLTAHDDATVAITPLIDLFVTKEDLPDPVQLNGRLTYRIVVGNNGPDAATQVTLADPLPAGTSFVSVSTTQGSCSGGALISCNLGTIAKGGTVTITLVVTAQRAGTLENTVTVVGNEPEANTANNRATARTLVVAPVVRTPQAVVCDKFTATPKSLTVGKRSTIVVRVTAAGKPVRGRKVVVKGAGILKTARTNGRGVARIVVRPRKAGIVTITVPQKIACGTKRIGVVGAFQPPVTG